MGILSRKSQELSREAYVGYSTLASMLGIDAKERERDAEGGPILKLRGLFEAGSISSRQGWQDWLIRLSSPLSAPGCLTLICMTSHNCRYFAYMGREGVGHVAREPRAREALRNEGSVSPSLPLRVIQNGGPSLAAQTSQTRVFCTTHKVHVGVDVRRVGTGGELSVDRLLFGDRIRGITRDSLYTCGPKRIKSWRQWVERKKGKVKSKMSMTGHMLL